ncbi:MAG: hypothetical protein RLZ98_3590 [Pseudomonadota bacterium]
MTELKNDRQDLRSRAATAFLSTALLLIPISPAGAEAAGVDPEAARLLERMTEFVGRQDRFSLETVNTVEVVLASGQKIQFTGGARTTVQRPNKLHSERVGDVISQGFFYDGKTVTLVNPDDGYYATVPAPLTIDGMLDFAREQLDVVAPAGDLITMDAYGRMMSDARSGFVVGKSHVGGVRCDHLAFRGYGVDWQIWIEDGERPVPRKYVITTVDLAQAPQAEILVTRWNLTPGIDAKQFQYSPPTGARQIEFLTLDTKGEQP